MASKDLTIGGSVTTALCEAILGTLTGAAAIACEALVSEQVVLGIEIKRCADEGRGSVLHVPWVVDTAWFTCS